MSRLLSSCTMSILFIILPNIIHHLLFHFNTVMRLHWRWNGIISTNSIHQFEVLAGSKIVVAVGPSNLVVGPVATFVRDNPMIMIVDIMCADI
ncbi:uncharacterized protein LOC106771341 isoform X3 [Vigna radiata var. radiata]|uniref:Uncharacterized protein LOC106771341 isoform X3 n=1 Tax=Vigna radiata var. radiata TaxID=3916 RepID=A0A3Q0FF93_VIGRR|nr:uncharacterized protein LOC106771341 isoform X3 [Vigna radiata var. radiata]